MKKASRPEEAARLEDIPNVGASIAGDLRRLGVKEPSALRGKDPLALYEALNRLAGRRHDPCLLDVFMAAVAFMDGKGAAPWFAFTARRKALLRAGRARSPRERKSSPPPPKREDRA